MPASEFELINKYFQDLTDKDPSVKCGIGDDAAIIQIPQDKEVVLSMDTLLGGTHFPVDTRPVDIGYKALAVNLSDMAAMGAVPKWVLLSISLPENNEAWLKEFASGFHKLARQHSVSLIGGDMSRGALSITINIQGLVSVDSALKRDGAQKDDLIYVTGTLGDAGAGLDIIQGKLSIGNECAEFFLKSLNRPDVSVEAGLRLRGLANSTIDISDGLIADLGHILDASHVGAEIEVRKIPLSEAMQQCVDETTAWNYALTSGDDYKLCFTASAEQHEQVISTFKKINIPVSCIGKIKQEAGLQLKTPEGTCFEPSGKSYQHF
ncbi:MAG: thiamine-phosphate kinase [Gammaproteobacteria bacterium]|nr:MAG: thiamine-phosphate kinase [Gammaproteobacteria bacterium]